MTNVSVTKVESLAKSSKTKPAITPKPKIQDGAIDAPMVTKVAVAKSANDPKVTNSETPKSTKSKKPELLKLDYFTLVTENQSNIVRRVFPDGYDLDAEAVALKSMIDAPEIDHADPMYPRYDVYCERLIEWDKYKAKQERKAFAEPEVDERDARKTHQMSGLESETEDSMTVHTLEAMRLYLGVAASPGAANRFGVQGGRRAATALRQLFLLTGYGNPYADWALVDTDQRIEAIRELIRKTESSHLDMLERARKKGLNYGVLAAKSPQNVSLGYHSPYGYAISSLIAEFDYCVRVMKSAERRDLIHKQQFHAAITRIKQECRSMFAAVIKSANVLMNKNMYGFTRLDFFPDANEAAVKRLSAAKQLLGIVPQPIFVRDVKPRHSMNAERLSAQERSALAKIILDAAPEKDASTAPVNTAGLVS